MLRDLVKLYGAQDRCIGIEPIDRTPFELMADVPPEPFLGSWRRFIQN